MATFVERESAAVQLLDLSLIERIQGGKQDVEIYRHPALGRVLVIDGELHHVEAWQDLYHEPLVHLPVSFIRVVRSVLILGGGCLYAAAEALKYASVERVDVVEHDENVIELMKRHYPHAGPVLSDKRVNVSIGDARRVHHSPKRTYDLIVSDCIDFSNEQDAGEPIHKHLETMLSSWGICSEVFYRHVLDDVVMKSSFNSLSRCTNPRFSLITVPEYPGIMHIHALWGRNPQLTSRSSEIENTEQKQHMLNNTLDLKFYDPAYRAFFLYLPPRLRHWLAP